MKNCMTTLFLVFLICACSHETKHKAPEKAATCSEKYSSGDLEIVKERILTEVLDTPLQIPKGFTGCRKPVAEYLKTMGPDGSWRDIDYKDMSTVTWKPATHLYRTLELCLAWATKDSAYYKNADLQKAISKAFDCWLKLGLERKWWWYTIGEPAIVGKIMIIFRDKLSLDQYGKGLKILKRAKLDNSGANLIWQAKIMIYRAVLENNSELLAKASTGISATINDNQPEGIQKDGSFFQHGPCLYNNGYGAAFALDIARLAVLLRNTSFALPGDKIRFLSNYILDSAQWLNHGNTPDFGTIGRQITRPLSPSPSRSYLAVLSELMLQIPTGREADYRAMLCRMQNMSAPPLVGNRCFYRGDIMVQHGPGWYISARMYSNRTMNTDILTCQEGLYSHYLAEGATCIMRSGKEYSGIFPVWDWQKIPGTTVEMRPHEPGNPSRKGEGSFAGGVSDGQSGVAAFDLRRDGLNAKKSWFFFPELTVCLGAGINCGSSRDVITTVNQSLLSGKIITNESFPAALSGNEYRMKNINWIWHDGVAYVFPYSQNLFLTAKKQTGSWKKISGESSAEILSKDIFSLWLAHGASPQNAAYEYWIIPGVNPENVQGFLARPPVKILSNTPDIQSVAYINGEARIFGTAFYKAGNLTSGDLYIGTDKPCVVICKKSDDGKWILYVADPSHETTQIKLVFRIPGIDEREIIAKLPLGAWSGATVSFEIKSKQEEK